MQSLVYQHQISTWKLTSVCLMSQDPGSKTLVHPEALLVPTRNIVSIHVLPYFRFLCFGVEKHVLNYLCSLYLIDSYKLDYYILHIVSIHALPYFQFLCFGVEKHVPKNYYLNVVFKLICIKHDCYFIAISLYVCLCNTEHENLSY